MSCTADEQTPKLAWLEKQPAEVQKSIQATKTLRSPGYKGLSSVPILSKVFVRADLEDVSAAFDPTTGPESVRLNLTGTLAHSPKG